MVNNLFSIIKLMVIFNMNLILRKIELSIQVIIKYKCLEKEIIKIHTKSKWLKTKILCRFILVLASLLFKTLKLVFINIEVILFKQSSQLNNIYNLKYN